MAINIGKGVLPRREERRMHFDTEEYSDGQRITVSFRQLSGPGRLIVRVQMAEGKRAVAAGDDGWTTLIEVGNYEDSDVPNDTSATLALSERYKGGGGAHLRAVVIARQQMLEERTYRLTVSAGKT